MKKAVFFVLLCLTFLAGCASNKYSGDAKEEFLLALANFNKDNFLIESNIKRDLNDKVDVSYFSLGVNKISNCLEYVEGLKGEKVLENRKYIGKSWDDNYYYIQKSNDTRTKDKIDFKNVVSTIDLQSNLMLKSFKIFNIDFDDLIIDNATESNGVINISARLELKDIIECLVKIKIYQGNLKQVIITEKTIKETLNVRKTKTNDEIIDCIKKCLETGSCSQKDVENEIKNYSYNTITYYYRFSNSFNQFKMPDIDDFNF